MRHLFVVFDNLSPRGFALANEEKVEKFVHRFGIDGARSACYDKGETVVAIFGKYGYAGKRKHVKNITVAHLVLQGKADKVEVGKGRLRFQRGKRQVALI